VHALLQRKPSFDKILIRFVSVLDRQNGRPGEYLQSLKVLFSCRHTNKSANSCSEISALQSQKQWPPNRGKQTSRVQQF
jgi:hypothetical protein